jgi:Amt family ammonium transporter
MQAGFTLVETDQDRWQYNNENLMDFCIGSILPFTGLLSLMYGDSISGFIGT